MTPQVKPSTREMRRAQTRERILSAATAEFTGLGEVVRLVMGLEDRLGRILFKERLALHFSPSRPQQDDWTDHPLIVLLVREIERARGEGEVRADVDAFFSATFFLLGIYGVLTTTDNLESRETMLTELVASAIRVLQIR